MAQTKPLETTNVYLDTSVFVAARFGYRRHEFATLQELAALGQTTLFVTTVLKREMRNRARAAAGVVALAAATFRKEAAILSETEWPPFAEMFKRVDKAALEQFIHARFEAYTLACHAERVDLSSVVTEDLFSAYFASAPPFEEGKDKKAEFPDAAVIAALNAYCQQHSMKMYVISGDKGLRAAALGTGTLIPLESLEEYLDVFTAQEVPKASIARAWVRRSRSTVEAAIAVAIADTGFIVDDADGDVNSVEVPDVTISRVLLLSVSDSTATFRLTGVATLEAEVVYYDPATGTYDNEEKEMVFQDRVDATLEDEQDITVDLTVDISEIETDGDPDALARVPFAVSVDGGKDFTISIYARHINTRGDTWDEEDAFDWEPGAAPGEEQTAGEPDDDEDDPSVHEF